MVTTPPIPHHESMDSNPATTGPKRISPHAVWFALPIIVYAGMVLAAGQTKPTPGVCSGIGWGCELSGSDAAAFAAILLALPAIGVLLAGHIVIAVVRRVRRNSS